MIQLLFKKSRFIYLCFFTFSILYASVNPFVIANRGRVKTDQIVIPIPQQQLLQKTSYKDGYLLDNKSNTIVLLKPFEALYIVTDAKSEQSIEAKVSQDGRLFYHQALSEVGSEVALPKKESQRIYKLQNSFSHNVTIKLASKREYQISLYTSYIWSALNNYTPKHLELPGEKVKIELFASGTSRLAYRFKKAEKFSFLVEGPGTLRIGMATLLNPRESLAEHRQRISLQINKKKAEYLESLDTLSHNSMRDEQPLATTYTSWHYRVLDEGENNITIETYGDISLVADIYKSYLVNQSNDSGLTWSVSNDYSLYNQAIWRNSNRDDALKRQKAINNTKKHIQDQKQRVALELLSKKSTVMKSLYPSQIPYGSQVSHLYYAPYRLYTQEEYQDIVSLDEVYNLYNINKFTQGFFCEVPNQAQAKVTKSYKKLLEKIHFRERQTELNDILKQQLKQFITELNSTVDIEKEKFILSGTTERLESVKANLLLYGIDQKNVRMQETPKSGEVTIYRALDSIEKHQLSYHFIEALDQERELEITLLGDDSTEINVDIDGQSRQILAYDRDTLYDTMRFSTLWRSYTQEKKADVLLALLHNRDGVAFSSQTATLFITLPKGTKSIYLSRRNDTKPIKASLKLREAKEYRDTDYALAFSYAGSYKKFASSLIERAISNRVFDAWYETTHPLRLWMQSRIYQAKNSINQGDLPTTQMFANIEEFIQNGDRLTVIQIAKHFLILDPDNAMKRKAYKLLIELSKDSREASLWHSIYFSQTGSIEPLEKIVDILREDGEFSLALVASLLLPRDKNYHQRGCSLALIQNRMLLGKYLCKDLESKSREESYLQKKREFLSHPKFSTAYYKDHTKLVSSAGVTTLYDRSKDTKLYHYKATKAQALKLSFNGPLTVDLDIRLLAPVVHYQWMKIVIDGQLYHYPLTQVEYSDTLESMSNQRF